MEEWLKPPPPKGSPPRKSYRCPPQHREIEDWFEEWVTAGRIPSATDLTPDSPPRKYEVFAFWTSVYESTQFQILLKKL